MIGDQAVTKFRDDWWRQPTREWENDPSEDVVIPGRPNESREIPDGGNPATDRDFAEEAEKIRRRLSDGPPPRNPDGDDYWIGEEPEDIDRCAYYVSFRYGSRWGIHIGLECWFSYSKYLFMNGVPANVAVDEAFYLLYRHEYFHFEVDKATEVLERLVDVSTGKKTDSWMKYHRLKNPSVLEEALANAHAVEHSGKRNEEHLKRVRAVFEEVLRQQGPGYCDFDAVSRGRAKGDARSQLLSEIMGIHRNDNSFVPGLQPLIRPPSYNKTAHDLPHVSYEGRRLNVYFF